jgi:hypothetical protein
MDTTSTLSTIAVVVSVAGAIFTAVNHSRIRSSCCGKKLEVSFDVDKTTPQAPAPIKAPESV